MSNTTILQGSFVSTGGNKFIPLVSGANWMKTYNTTALSSPANLETLSAYWQTGFAPNSSVANVYIAASTACVETFYTTHGFTLIDTSIQTPGLQNNTITGISTAAAPVVTNTGVNGLTAGTVVRLINCQGGAKALTGIDWVVGSSSLTNTTFSLASAPQLATAGTTGSWRVIPFGPMYQPPYRIIASAISVNNTTVFATSVPHGYQIGQQVRLYVPDPLYGDWVSASGVQMTIIAIDSELEFTTDLNSTPLGLFEFPVTATTPFSPAFIEPVGMNTAYAYNAGVNILSDATYNTAQIGMLLEGGAASPAGSSGDVIYWQAGTVFSTDNQ